MLQSRGGLSASFEHQLAVPWDQASMFFGLDSVLTRCVVYDNVSITSWGAQCTVYLAHRCERETTGQRRSRAPRHRRAAARGSRNQSFACAGISSHRRRHSLRSPCPLRRTQ